MAVLDERVVLLSGDGPWRRWCGEERVMWGSKNLGGGVPVGFIGKGILPLVRYNTFIAVTCV